MNNEQLRLAMNGKDIVYANLSGNMKEQAETIVHAMKSTGGIDVQWCACEVSEH